MGPSLSTLISILMNESVCKTQSMTNQSMTNQSFSPRIHKHFNNVTRSYTNKNMRRNHQIKQPGFDVQRKHVIVGNHCNRKR